MAQQIAHPEGCDQCGHNFSDKDHRISHQSSRIQFRQRVFGGLRNDCAVEQCGCSCCSCHVNCSNQNVLPASIKKCSTMGLSASAGKYCKPPRIKTTPVSRAMNIVPWVGKLPDDAGTLVLAARDPAMAIIGTM